MFYMKPALLPLILRRGKLGDEATMHTQYLLCPVFPGVYSVGNLFPRFPVVFLQGAVHLLVLQYVVARRGSLEKLV